MSKFDTGHVRRTASLGVRRLLGCCAALSAASFTGCVSAGGPKSMIANFSPSAFDAQASARFFYSINDDLKNADRIDPLARTLVHGPFRGFLVSPDGNKIAIVAQGRLLIVGTESVLAEVTTVENWNRRFKPLGQQFFWDDDFQWSRDSKSLYLIRDEFIRASQFWSNKRELWRYDLNVGTMNVVIKPFDSLHYFLGDGAEIYYTEPTARGDLQLKRFDGRTSTNVGEPNANDIVLEHADGSRVEPFYSFSVADYQKALALLNVRLARNHGDETLLIQDRSSVSVTQGKGWDGYYHCAELGRSVFLPGNNFFLLNTPYCGNHNGQLLIDVESGRYQALPANTKVFSTLNTATFEQYRVKATGIEIK
jgi:hypothetical protein